MADNGVESINTDELAAVDDLLGHRDGAVGRVRISVLGTQLVGSGPVADAIAEATAQVTSDVIWAATWTDLQTYTPATDGVGAEVMDADTGTHSAASATGYDGATVDNAGRYAWNLGWGRWVRISDTGLSAKSDVGHTHTADQISDSSAAGRALLTAEDAEAQRGALGLGSAATAASGDFIAAGMAMQGRPGAYPERYTETLTGGHAAAAGAPGTTVTTARGAVRRLAGGGVLATRERFALSPGDFYEIAWAFARSTNPTDPNGDTVRLGIQWLDEDFASVGQLTDASLDLTPTVADGRQFVTVVIGEDADVAGVDFGWPAGAVHAVPFLHPFGSDGVTDAELIEWRGGGGALASDTVVLEAGGTADAITATADRRYSDEPFATLFVMEVASANTGAVTMSIGGETAKDLLLNSGAALQADYLLPGMLLDFRWDGADYRLTTGASATAIEAAAAASAAAAALSASEADASASVAETAEAAALSAQSSAETARDQSQASSDLTIFAAAFDAAADLDGTGLSADDYVVVWADEDRENKVAIYQWNGSTFDFVRVWQGNSTRRDAVMRHLPYRIARMQAAYGFYDEEAVTGDLPVIALLDSTSNQPWTAIAPILADMVPDDTDAAIEPWIEASAGSQGLADLAVQSLSGATVATNRWDVWPTGELIEIPAGTYTVPLNIMNTWATAVFAIIGAVGGGRISASVDGAPAAADLDTSTLTENRASIWEVTNPNGNTRVELDLTITGGSVYVVHAWGERTDVNRLVRHARFRKGGTGLEDGWSEADCRANFRTVVGRINPALITYHDRANASLVETYFPLILNDIFTATSECDVLTIGGLPIFDETNGNDTGVLDQNTLLEFYADQYFENGYPSFYVNPYDSYLIDGDPERAQTASENMIGTTDWRDATGTHWTLAGSLGVYHKVARIIAAMPVARASRSLVPKVIGVNSIVRNASSTVLKFVPDGTYGLILSYFNSLKMRDANGVVRFQLGNGTISAPDVMPEEPDLGSEGSGRSMERGSLGALTIRKYLDTSEPTGYGNLGMQIAYLRPLTVAQAQAIVSSANGNDIGATAHISGASNGDKLWQLYSVSGSPTWKSVTDRTILS